MAKLSVARQANRTAWMNSEIFSNKRPDNIDAKMKKNCRQTLLFIDNCPYHLADVQLHSVKLVLFPTNMTSIVQPLDQDVIHSFKCHCLSSNVRETHYCLMYHDL